MIGEVNKELTLLLENELIEINDYLLASKNRSPRLGLYSGSSGSCLYLCQYHKATKDTSILEQLYNLLDDLIKRLDEQKKINCAFSSGMAGIGWMLEYLSDSNIIEKTDNELFDQIDILLFEHMKKELADNNIDQLNGAIGIGWYFLRRKKATYLNIIIDYLNNTKVTDENETKWYSEDWDTKTNFYNFSLAQA